MVDSRKKTAIEDYLKVIFNLGEWGVAAQANSDIAAALHVSTSSASEMIRKLSEQGLVSHQAYGPVELTPRGRRCAVDMVRRHRLVETYLVQELDYTWDEVHDEAEVLEHAVSTRLISRIDRRLGHPHRDPHGDPIPTAEGVVHQPVARSLSALWVGEVGYVARIGDHDPQLLRWLTDQGIGLDTRLTVTELKPFGGPTVVGVDDESEPPVELGPFAVTALWVADDPPLPGGRVPDSGCPYVRCRHVT